MDHRGGGGGGGNKNRTDLLAAGRKKVPTPANLCSLFSFVSFFGGILIGRYVTFTVYLACSCSSSGRRRGSGVPAIRPTPMLTRRPGRGRPRRRRSLCPSRNRLLG